MASVFTRFKEKLGRKQRVNSDTSSAVENDASSDTRESKKSSWLRFNRATTSQSFRSLSNLKQRLKVKRKKANSEPDIVHESSEEPAKPSRIHLFKKKSVLAAENMNKSLKASWVYLTQRLQLAKEKLRNQKKDDDVSNSSDKHSSEQPEVEPKNLKTRIYSSFTALSSKFRKSKQTTDDHEHTKSDHSHSDTHSEYTDNEEVSEDEDSNNDEGVYYQTHNLGGFTDMLSGFVQGYDDNSDDENENDPSCIEELPVTDDEQEEHNDNEADEKYDSHHDDHSEHSAGEQLMEPETQITDEIVVEQDVEQSSTVDDVEHSETRSSSHSVDDQRDIVDYEDEPQEEERDDHVSTPEGQETDRGIDGDNASEEGNPEVIEVDAEEEQIIDVELYVEEIDPEGNRDEE